MKTKLTLLFMIIIGIMIFLQPISKATTDEGIIEDGIYSIQLSANNQKTLQVLGDYQSNESPIRVWDYNKNTTQKFEIKYLEDGYYQIKHLYSGRVLDVYGSGKYNGAKVEIYDWYGTDNQKWEIKKNEDNTYSFISKCNGLYLDIYGGQTGNGTVVQMYSDNGGAKSQKFLLEKFLKYDKNQTIEDGIYSIQMSSNLQKIIQILGDSKSNESPTGIWNYNKNITQKFEIKYLENGDYQIKHLYSGKVLDVYGSGKHNGAKVEIYDWYGTDNQKWKIKINIDGTYSLISKCNDLYLDVYGGFTENGTIVQMYSDNGGAKSQKFVFEKHEEINPVKSIDDGVYVIKTSYNHSKVLEVQGTNIQIGTNQKKQNQKFRVEEIDGTGYYKITSVNFAKSLDVNESSKSNGANVQIYNWCNTDNQKWIIKLNQDNTYTLFSKCSELALDVYGSSSLDGANVQTYMPNGGNAQKFVFEQVPIIEDGEYELESKLRNDQVIDIENGSPENLALALLWETNNTQHQKFYLKYVNDGMYKIIIKGTNKVLSVGENSDVYQYDDVNDIGQLWQIREAEEGYYYIYSKLNDFYLTVQNDSAENGSRIIGTVKSEKDAQKFKITNEIRTYFEQGTYGKSGLAVIGDARGTDLKYYKFGKGPNVLFATYSIHGFEDNYAHDGTELTYIAETFKNYLLTTNDASLFYEWKIYLFPTVNPDGQVYGWTEDGPGRTTLVSAAPNGQGIDINRNWQIQGEEYKLYKEERNYNGTAGFQAYEAIALRDFLLSHRATNGQTILVDLHGWLEETIGDDELGAYYRNEFNLTKHVKTYGIGYLVNWARSTLGVSKQARSVLVELPPVYSHEELVQRQFAEKYINATINMLKDVSAAPVMYSFRNLSSNLEQTEPIVTTQYQIALAGTIKNEKPLESEIEEIISEIPNEEGIYITEESREQFRQILDEYGISEQQLEEKLEKGKRYIIDITDTCYIRDEISNEIIEYPFVELDSTQICEPFENGNDVLLCINSNKDNKLMVQEIIEAILQY